MGTAGVAVAPSTAAVETEVGTETEAVDGGLRLVAGRGSVGRSDWTGRPATASFAAVAAVDGGGGTGATERGGTTTPRVWFAAGGGWNDCKDDDGGGRAGARIGRVAAARGALSLRANELDGGGTA